MSNITGSYISVENFGPVKKGKVQIKPLTIFIGANNSGKTYVAQLIYAITQGLRGRIPGSFPQIHTEKRQDAKKIKEEILLKLTKSKQEKKPIRILDLPDSFQTLCEEWVKEIVEKMPETLEEAIRDYFGCEDARELIRQDEHLRTLKVLIKDDENALPFMNFKMKKLYKKSVIEWNLPAYKYHKIEHRLSLFEREIYDLDDFIRSFMMDWWRSTLKQNGLTDRSAYYLPGARSGILQGQQLFATMFAEYTRRSIGLRRLDIPPFSGVAGDFLQVLWERIFSRQVLRKGRKFLPENILQILEGDIFKGKVILERSRKEVLLLYESKGMKIPLHRASSMVAELAPLDLWIKEIINPGDLLIIDEPEAHLHPSSQRAIARVITRLVRSEVKVLVTTHSPLILQQLSNCILASGLDQDTAKKYGMNKDDILNSDEVGVYLFKMMSNGTQIEEVSIEKGFGISEESFIQVFDEIGEETFRLSAQHPINR